MALSKIQAESMNLADTFAFSGTVSGTSVSGTNAFSARTNADEWGSVSDGAIVQFTDDSTGDSFDTDSCYNTSTYKFTAPATGVYMFWFAIYAADGDTDNGFAFLKNSTKLSFIRSSSGSITFQSNTNNDHTQNGTIIVPLTSGDTMAVCGATGSDYYKGQTAWGGCRLA